jgi:ankyrin repeat protein
MRYARSKMFALVLAVSLSAAGINAFAAGDARLADAAMTRDAAAVRALIGQKVDVNAPGKDGTPALHWAVRGNDLGTAELLLRAGANPKLANRYGVTPLFLACSNGNAEMIRLLLDAGADPNGTDQTGETALMMAARVGTIDAVKRT